MKPAACTLARTGARQLGRQRVRGHGLEQAVVHVQRVCKHWQACQQSEHQVRSAHPFEQAVQAGKAHLSRPAREGRALR